MTVHDMLERMPSTELTEWVALWAVKAEEREKAEAERRLKRL